jgi:predicted HTH domain antitoxin
LWPCISSIVVIVIIAVCSVTTTAVSSWNYRILFDVELGHNSRAMKFPYFHLQLWDRDLLKWNDCAGEGIIDLGKFYRKAYKRNIAIKLFEKKKGLAAKRAKKDKKKRNEFLLNDTTEDIPPEEYDPEEDDLDLKDLTIPANEFIVSPMMEREGPGGATAAAEEGKDGGGRDDGVNGGKFVKPSALLPPRDEPDSDDDEDTTAHLDSGLGAIPKVLPKSSANKKEGYSMQKQKPILKKKKTIERAGMSAGGREEAGGGYFQWVYFWRKSEPIPTDEQKLLDGEDGGDKKEGDEEGGEKTEEEKKEDEDTELRDLVTTFKNMTGLWDIDPDDAA